MNTLPNIPGKIRPLNLLRDLRPVADLVELCFQDTMDEDGRTYVRQMRRASQDKNFLRWASLKIESVSMPLSGYVWEKDGRIVGNVSLIPFRRGNQKIYLIANVAVHPEYRRQGIARALTLRARTHARQAGAAEIWLHVRDDNLGALRLYESLGFVERARRASWRPQGQPSKLDAPSKKIQIVSRRPAYWKRQYEWLQQNYPEIILWYHYPDWRIFGAGMWQRLRRLFSETEVRQWAALKNGELQAVLSWQPAARRRLHAPLWLAAPVHADADALRALLLYVRWELARDSLNLDYPDGKNEDALRAAGFQRRHTLVWMRAEREPSVSTLR